MDKAVLLSRLSQAQQNAERRDQLISQQRDVTAMLVKEGLDANHSKRLLTALVSARDKDIAEMDLALDELDKTKRYASR